MKQANLPALLFAGTHYSRFVLLKAFFTGKIFKPQHPYNKNRNSKFLHH